MRVLFVASEIYPLIKTGGLADVAGALPPALRKLGVDVRVLVPAYPKVSDALAFEPVATQTEVLPGAPRANVLLGHLGDGELPVYALQCASLYERAGGPYNDEQGRDFGDNALRFGALSRCAALIGTPGTQLSKALGFTPDVVHLNDWQSGLAAAYLALSERRGAPALLSIHNIAYGGIFGAENVGALALPLAGYRIDGYEFHGNIGFLKAGVFYAQHVATVSPRYAEEIRTPAFGVGLEGLLTTRGRSVSGILNGIDDVAWNPRTDPHLDAHYDADDLGGKAANKAALQRELGLREEAGVPLLANIGRMTPQKGIDLLPAALGALSDRPFQLVVLGSGAHDLEERFRALERDAPHRVRFVNAVDERMAHRIEAGADLFLMPSRFEPCGLNQMYSMRYGTPPIVHRTGGLADTVHHATRASIEAGEATGFVFDVADAEGLRWATERALDTYADTDLWQALQRNAMRRDFGWQRSAAEYAALYRRLAPDAA